MTSPGARRPDEDARQPPIVRVMLAVLIVAVCIALKVPLDAIAGAPIPPFITVLPAVIAVALVAGTALAVASVPVTAAVAWLLWLSPGDTPHAADRHTLVSLALFVGVGVVLAVIVGRVRHYQDRLVRQSAFLRTLLETSPGPTAVVEGEDLRFSLVSRSFEALKPGTAMVGRTVREVFGPDAADLEGDIARVLRTGEAHRAVARPMPGSVQPDATYDRHIVCLPATRGEPRSALLVAWDTSDHARAERALKASEHRLTELAESMPQLVWRARDDGRIDYYNSRLALYVGAERLTSGDWTWEGLLHPDDLAPTDEAWAAAVSAREEFQAMHRLRMADGAWRWHLSRARPVADAAGVVHWFGTATDIHDRVEAEEKVHVLLAEVNHRAKNMLALVQAVARQTVRGEPADFLKRFEQRIQALAASQDLLVSSGWEGIDLAGLVRAQLAHFSDLVGSRITVDGPPVTLKSTAAQALGMALHELATNAGKYGALAASEGTVAIGWRLTGEAGGTLELSWTERGGPAAEAPQREGFGSVVTGRMVEAALRGKVDRRFSADGFSWRLVCPVDDALASGGAADPATASEPGDTPDEDGTAPPVGRVLVVEDEALVALEIASVLSDAGFQVLGPAANVAQALDVLSRGPCDVGVLDVNLGPETSEAVAERLIEAGVPFVTVSGYAPEQRPGVFAGAPFLGKPLVRPELLVAALSDCLATRAAQATGGAVPERPPLRRAAVTAARLPH